MNYAPRLSMFKRDKYLFVGVHAGLSTGELGVLLVLLATEKGEIAHRSTLWTDLRGVSGDKVDLGPLLPWSRQGVCKAIEALTRRGWVQDIPSGWGSERDLGLRLLPIVIEAAMPKWLPRLLVPAGPESATSVASPPAQATPKAKRASSLFPVEKALSRVSRDLVATAAKRMGRRKPERVNALTSLVGVVVPKGPNLVHERNRLKHAGARWSVVVEPRRKPKVGRVQDCKHWTARFLGVGGQAAERKAVADTPGGAVRALVKSLADSNAAAVVAVGSRGAELWLPITDPKQVIVSFSGRGLDREWNKFPKSETWAVRLRAGKRGGE